MDDLKIIKKYFGEKMAHLCRDIFSTLLEDNGVLSSLLLEYFEPNKELYNDLIKRDKVETFKDFIMGLINPESQIVVVDKTPKELLLEAGYDLYECHSEKDIQKFKKYYAKNEVLCTFYGGRLNRCYVFFAVKKNALELERKDFIKPERQDEYGTSVISIQFSKGAYNSVSIKNRYNHTVYNPDATFSNNLDNIIPGLTESFKLHYNLNLDSADQRFNMAGYVRANDGKFYKFNYEINNIYYCPNNLIIDNHLVNRDYQQNERYLLIDAYIIDLKEKNIRAYDTSVGDSFVDGLSPIERINITKNDNGNKIIEILIPNQEKVVIEINKNNEIISYINNNLEEIGDKFLYSNKELRYLEINNVKKIGNYCLKDNIGLKQLDIGKVEQIGSYFLFKNEGLDKINVNSLKIVGAHFLSSNDALTSIDLPNLEYMNNYFLHWNSVLSEINVPKLKEIEDNCLTRNKKIKKVLLPNVIRIGDYFLKNNEILDFIYLPKVQIILSGFLQCNKSLTEIYLPSLKSVCHDFLLDNNLIKQLYLENLESIGTNFICHNDVMTKFVAPKLKSMGKYFLSCNTELEELEFEELISTGKHFMPENNKLKRFIAPKLTRIDYYFLENNTTLEELSIPSIEEIYDFFLPINKNYTSLGRFNLRKTAIKNKFIKKVSIVKMHLSELKEFIIKEQKKKNIRK